MPQPAIWALQTGHGVLSSWQAFKAFDEIPETWRIT